MSRDVSSDPIGQPALAVPVEPASGLAPSGFDQAQHTPGPWMRDGFAVTPYAPAGEKRRTICIASPDLKLSPKASMDQMRADARLIAAAPDLLEALAKAIWLIDDKGIAALLATHDPVAWANVADWLPTANAAIAKATRS